MNLRLVDEKDPVLLEVCDEWDFETNGDPSELVKEMGKLMTASGGIGLSAPQCGITKRIFVMGNQDDLVACINPKIVEMSKVKVREKEGCLSFPELWLSVERPESITVSYQTVTGEVVEKELHGLHARVYLHELDHLLGITFDQRVGEVSLSLARKKQKKKKKKLNLLS